jgi:hypothetical protein
VRRLFIVALGSALFLSACGTSTASPNASPTPTEGASAAGSQSTAEASPPHGGPPTAIPGWIVFAPADQGFSAAYPGQPTLQTQTIQTTAGPVPTSVWYYEESEDLSYYVALAKYPEGSLSSGSLSDVYDTAVTDMSHISLGMTVGGQGDVTVNGHAGRTFTVANSAAMVKGELIAVGDNLYKVYVLCLPAASESPNISAFLAAFTLTV